ncbi:MAG: DUF2798 domain-containing protein [Gammaproteobacteria bacterium]
MALLMSSIMSLVISIINVGTVPNIPSIWARAWFLAFWVGLPTTYFVSPVLARLVSFTLESENQNESG